MGYMLREITCAIMAKSKRKLGHIIGTIETSSYSNMRSAKDTNTMLSKPESKSSAIMVASASAAEKLN
jgi:hypothetical protein